MSKWSDGAELLQKLISAKELIPARNDLINLQQTMFSLQSDQIKLVDQNQKLKEENANLRKKKEYKYADGHSYMINPDNPSLKLCPTCLNRDNFENPMQDYDSGGYCHTCKKAVE